MSKQMIYKSSWVTNDSDEARVIDSNELFVRKLGERLEKENGTNSNTIHSPIQQTDLSDDSLAQLFDDNQGDGEYHEDNGQVFDGEEETFGDEGEGFVQGIQGESVELQEMSSRYQQMLEDARLEADAILERAQQEVEELKERAYNEGYALGQQSGHEEGMHQASMVLAQKENDLQQREQMLEKAYYDQMAELEPKFVAVLTDIYEKVLNVELRHKNKLITHILANALRKIDGQKEYLIHVSPMDYKMVLADKEQLLAQTTSNANIEVIEDVTLLQDECLIETESGIFDCSLGVQLEELKQQLILLSYERDS